MLLRALTTNGLYLNIGPGHTSVRPGRADRFLAPKSEGERDLVSLGMVAAGCRRPDGLWEGKVKLAETPAYNNCPEKVSEVPTVVK